MVLGLHRERRNQDGTEPYWPLWKRILSNRFKPSWCARTLQGVGFESPSWAELAEGQAPGGAQEEDPCQPHLGWQQQASSALERP